MKQYLIDRIREPSTYAGLGILLTLLGAPVAPGTMELVQQLVTAAAGLIAIIAKESNASA